ncbi:MAG: energy transducer TonB [Candidatus Xiphinematobacter sp.]|nr:MAG: energy transducer TonB [Candidatus Xiphinematobacter sp.]
MAAPCFRKSQPPSKPKPTPKPKLTPSKPVSSDPYISYKGKYVGYNQLIHDCFYSQWDQPPASFFSPQQELACILEVQITQDGRISSYQIIGGSRNAVLDRSVLEASKRVKQIAPLPVSLRVGGVYTVRIEFKCSS